MTPKSPSSHQRTLPERSERARARRARLLAGGASLVVLAGLGVALFSAQLGQNSAAQREVQVRDTVLAASSDAAAGDRTGPPASAGAGAENPDGRLPFGTTASDTQYAGIGKLAPELLGALQEATSDAEAEGVYVMINSGWRSAALQGQLLQDAVAEYGSAEEAARWVATPETSLHVSGDAVDVEGAGASDWLAANGAKYGLCLTYLNEPWHFEFQATAPSSGCAEPYPDPTYDPRLHA